MHRLAGWLAVAAIIMCGCSKGQPSGRPDIDAIPEAELRGAAIKASVYELQAKVRKRGVAAVKQELPEMIEVLTAYERLKLGEHQETYKQINEKLKALQASAASATKDSAIKATDEIGALADKLPGKAEKNPQVE
jgi:hypothetical protein